MKALVLALSLGALATNTLLAQGGIAEVRIENVAVSGSHVTADLVNRGSVPLTAWVVELRGETPAGFQTHSRQTSDVYVTPSLAEISPGADKTIRQGEYYSITFASPARNVSEVRVALVALVRADGTTEGDETIIEQIFNRRLDDLETARRMMPTLQSREKLGAQETLRRLGSSAASVRSEAAAGLIFDDSLAQSVQQELGQLEANRVAPEAALSMIALILEKRLAAAEKHSQRKK